MAAVSAEEPSVFDMPAAGLKFVSPPEYESAKGLITTDFCAIPSNVRWEIGYLILFATFFAYFLIPLGQKHIRPTLVSMYTYLQPIIAAIVSIATGMDVITWQKALATALVVGGVVLVSRSRAAAANAQPKTTRH